ncbi:response regulator [Pseudoclavibacter terrae]|uniref:Response regulator transcription factor n=1 Tax=Pseudoclavibacter terrae TaxID=1530195 RepID=A0A7J5AXM8_9MICO|nr:response regulator transcription factor [Pseudoclavibacter terrae]KAB1636084.1 response regulator transcription factor [Pseudoclavibacter terrae]
MRVLIVDDQSMIRAGLRSLLLDHGVDVAGEASNGQAALQHARALRPDVVLIDLHMPVMSGVTAIERMRADTNLAGLRILVLTTFDGDVEVLDALRAGADGFLGKAADAGELLSALHQVAGGATFLSERAARAVLENLRVRPSVQIEAGLGALLDALTPKEREVVAAAARGLDNQEIAAEMQLSPLTVKTHLNRAMAKVEARDRGQLVAFAYRSGLMFTTG